MKTLARVIGACIGAGGLIPIPASAQVMEIGGDGALIVVSEAVSADAARRPAPPSDIADAIKSASEQHGVDEALLRAVAWTESRWKQSAVSPKGAMGVMQLMAETAQELGVDATDMRDNIDGGAAYLAAMLERYKGDTLLALAAYNAGPGSVDSHGGIPPYRETRAYVNSVLALAALGDTPRVATPFVLQITP
jgi:soluble lytic murein transglycosylase-like protein